MAIVVTYICDVTGKTSVRKDDFVDVTITAHGFFEYSAGGNSFGINNSSKKTINKFIHKDVALRLNLIAPPPKVEPQPEPTLESKLMVLLKEYVHEIAYEAGAEAGSEAASNYNRG